MTACKKPFLRGFTLVELMVVISVMVLLMTLAGPAMKLILDSSKSENTAEELSLVSEWARAEAVGKSTYVWVRLGEPTASNKGASSDLEVRLWSSKDGTELGTPENLQELRRATRYESLSLAIIDRTVVERPEVSRTGKVEGSAWLIFSPDGSVRTMAAQPGAAPPHSPVPQTELGLERWIEIGLQPTKGGIVTPALQKKGVVLQIAGLTGQPVIYRR